MADQDRLVLPATCHDHGTAGYTNFLARKVAGGVEFEPHAAGGCIVHMPWAEVRKLIERLKEWLG